MTELENITWITLLPRHTGEIKIEVKGDEKVINQLTDNRRDAIEEIVDKALKDIEEIVVYGTELDEEEASSNPEWLLDK